MKITEPSVSYSTSAIEIVKAEITHDYTIRIKFADNTQKEVNFAPFLHKSQHPSIKKYLEPTLFGKFEIIDGNLNWADFDLIFPIWDLYNGSIE